MTVSIIKHLDNNEVLIKESQIRLGKNDVPRHFVCPEETAEKFVKRRKSAESMDNHNSNMTVAIAATVGYLVSGNFKLPQYAKVGLAGIATLGAYAAFSFTDKLQENYAYKQDMKRFKVQEIEYIKENEL